MSPAVWAWRRAFETDLGDRVVATGSRLFSGDLVVQGALLNRGEGNLLLRFADGERALLEPGMGVVVRESQAEEALISSCSACSVSCGPGFYACCKRETLFSCASCTCKPNGSTNTCHSGGPGATSCSVGTASAASEASAGEPDLSVD